MADNVPITAGSGTNIAADDISSVWYQRVKLVDGTADSTAAIPGDATNGLDVDVTRLPALPAGTNNIGDVDVLTVPAPLSTTGGGTEATAHRVTIANDSTGVLSVDDNGGSLTVDNGGTFAVQATLAAGAAAIAKAEDVASADADVGVPSMAVRKATPANTSGTDGDYEMLQMSAGRLWASALIDTALPAGTNAIGKLAANTGVDIGDVDVTSIIPGTGATNLGKAEDSAHASGDTGVMALGVRRSDANALTALAGTDDDYAPLVTDTRGVQMVVTRPYHYNTKIISAGLTTATTAYTAGDQLGTILTFTNAAKISGGGGMIRSITLLDKADIITDVRLHLFKASVTLASDNAAFAVSDADGENCLGVIDLPTALDCGNYRIVTYSGVGLGYVCAATSLFVALETRAGHTFFGAATDLHLTIDADLD